MTTLTLVIVIILFSILLWVVPQDAFLKKLIYVVALVCVLLWVLGLFGVLAPYGLR